MDKNPGTQVSQYIQVTANRQQVIQSPVIQEALVSLTVNGEVWLTFLCTPVDLEAIAVGFLYNEGFIQSREEIADVRVCPGNENIDIWLNRSIERPKLWKRTSGCTGGLTQVETTDTSQDKKSQFDAEMMISSECIYNLVGKLYEGQTLYRQSGGVHTSALSDGERLCVVAEDVGRHNTLDKLAGKILIDEIFVPCQLIITTGRISSEMLQKAFRLGTPFVVSCTAVTSLAIQLAERWGITLIGYARRDRFNVYTHPERILHLSMKQTERVDHAETNL